MEQEDNDDDDDDLIGPMPPKDGEQNASGASLAREIEDRANRMKDRIEGKDREQGKEPKREQWMTELPKEKNKQFGLGPRQFNRSNKDTDKGNEAKARREWIETPEMKAKRARGEVQEEEEEQVDHSQDKDVLEYLAGLKRDQEMEKISKELKSKRGDKSLMEEHTKKRAKAAKEASSASSSSGLERRPFDRDIDLQANRFDNAQKELMIKKARQLDSKFSAGEKKYL